MKKRVLSLLLALVLIFQMTPLAFAAELEEEPAEEEIVEELPEEWEEEVTEEVPEESEEAQPEEMPESAAEAADSEKIEEEAAPVQVRFVFDGEYSLTVFAGETEVEPAETGENEAIFLLTPGEYRYLARIRGHIGTAAENFTVETEEMTLEPALEKYPCDLPGLPLDYLFTQDELDARKNITESEMLDAVRGGLPGVDYIEDQLMFSTEDEEKAALIAEAFGAELVGFDMGIAVIQLNGITVEEALTAAADMDLMLPAAEPNFIFCVEPVEDDGSLYELPAFGVIGNSKSWRTWYDNVSASNRDTYLKDPGSNNYQYMHDVVNTYEAWGITTGKPAICVAVVDSGLATHSDVTAARKGYSTLVASSSADKYGHGTHVAGIIGAKMGNGIGGSGIAPGVSLYVYKALDDTGSGSSASIAAGIRWAVNQGADIINLSVGGPGYNAALKDEVQKAIDAGCTVVCAMGNNGKNIKNYPAALNLPGMINVTASDRANQLACYSNYGSHADVMAPGTDIMSTWMNGGYMKDSGTSMAAPVVSGICALYMSKYGHKTVTPKEMEKIVKASKTNGIIDAYKVISKGPKVSTTKAAVSNGVKEVTCTDRIPMNFQILLAPNGDGVNGKILYTLDGTYPGCIDGEVTNGFVYNGGIDLSGYSVGDEVTVTSLCMLEDGETGDVNIQNYVITEAVDLHALTVEGPQTVASGGKAAFIVVDYEGIPVTEGITWSVIGEEGVSIDENGVLTVDSENSTVITVMAAAEDGTTVEYTVNVEAAAMAIVTAVTGPDTVLAGKSGTYKAAKSDKKAKVRWTVEDYKGTNVKDGYVTISSAGVLKVSKNAANGTRVRVRAYGPDNASSSKLVYVNKPVSKVNIAYKSGGYETKYNKNGVLTEITLYSTPSPKSPTQNAVTLSATTEGNPNAGVEWLGTNKLITVSSTGKVTAVPGKTGTATVTAKAKDGTGKKATVKIKVVNQASRLAISTGANTMNLEVNSSTNDIYGIYNLGAGKSVSHKALVGDAYGKPSSTKVEWHAVLKRGTTAIYTQDNTGGYFSIKGGKLTVSKNMKNLAGFETGSNRYSITVYAKTTDGTNLKSNEITYNIAPAVSKLAFRTTVATYASTVTCTLNRYDSKNNALTAQFYTSYDGKVYYSSGTFNSNAVIVTTSNSDIAYAVLSTSGNRITICTGHKAGKATITLKANDGSGKSCKVIVNVK